VGDTTVTDFEEKYGLNWQDKRAARQLALTLSTGTLRPCPDESIEWNTTKASSHAQHCILCIKVGSIRRARSRLRA
jgi:hypothetical protein